MIKFKGLESKKGLASIKESGSKIGGMARDSSESRKAPTRVVSLMENLMGRECSRTICLPLRATSTQARLQGRLQ
jgi:hypothetical protein